MISIKTIGDPLNKRTPVKAPMPANLLGWNFALLSKSVNRRTRNFEQFRSFIDGQDFGWRIIHVSLRFLLSRYYLAP